MPKQVWSLEGERRLIELWHELDTSSEGQSMTKKAKAEVLKNKLQEDASTDKDDSGEALSTMQVIFKLDTLHRKAKKFYSQFGTEVRKGAAVEVTLDLKAACADWANFRLWHQLFGEHPTLGGRCFSKGATVINILDGGPGEQVRPASGLTETPVTSATSTVQVSKYCNILPLRFSTSSAVPSALSISGEEGNTGVTSLSSGVNLRRHLSDEVQSPAGHLSMTQSTTTPGLEGLDPSGGAHIHSANAGDVVTVLLHEDHRHVVAVEEGDIGRPTQTKRRHDQTSALNVETLPVADEHGVNLTSQGQSPAKVAKLVNMQIPQEEVRNSLPDPMAARVDDTVKLQLSFQQLQANLAAQRIESEERRERQFLEYLERKDRERVQFEERRERERQEYEERRERERRVYEERREEERQRREDEWRRTNQEFQLKLFMQMEKLKRSD